MRDEDIYRRYGALMVAIVRTAMRHWYPYDGMLDDPRTRNSSTSTRLTKTTVLEWEIVSRTLLGAERWEQLRLPRYIEMISEIDKEFSHIRRK